MKGMLPAVGALVVAVGCGARTFLATGDVAGGASEDASSSKGDLGEPGDDSTKSPGPGFSLVPLTPDPDGSVDTLGIAGTWYVYSDGWGSDGNPEGGVCESVGGFTPVQCSSIQFPRMPQMSFQGPPGTFCLVGTAAEVIPMQGSTTLDYSDIFGIGMGLDLDHPVNGVKSAYDATNYNVVGFQFDITGVPDGAGGEVRVELPTSETSSEDGYDSYGETLTNPLPDGGVGTQILFRQAKQFFASATPTSFNPSQLYSVLFHVPCVSGNKVPVSRLCVSNLQAIVQN